VQDTYFVNPAGAGENEIAGVTGSGGTFTWSAGLGATAWRLAGDHVLHVDATRENRTDSVELAYEVGP